MTDPVLVLLAGAVLGLVLGLLGGGGGILAVPMLVALGEPVLVASTMSLVIVGVGASAALVPHHRAGRVDWRIGLIFGALGAVGAVVGSRIAPMLSASVLLAGLVVLLAIGAWLMLRGAYRAWKRHVDAMAGTETVAGIVTPGVSVLDASRAPEPVKISWPKTIVLATAVGLVTGVFGVGAGFVVVPALTAAMHVPVRRATATALVVIVINSAVALVARHEHMGPATMTVTLAVATAAFSTVGAMLSPRIPTWLLSAAFGTLMVVVAIYTLGKVVTS
ncbi:MAG: sulfite exporter TauE/SafE family protein [Actinobacteria bacterium]|nr:sulfite exporter TauE/SafE family protein [Actinomycetota bacterium]